MLVYTVSTRGQPTTFRIDVSTGRRTLVGRGKASVTPNSTNVLLVTEMAISGLYRGRLSLVKPDGSRTVLDERIMAFGNLGWSPDGTEVAYMKQSGLWIADLRTRKARQVLHWNLPRAQAKGPLVWK